jgi:hypothetical protein
MAPSDKANATSATAKTTTKLAMARRIHFLFISLV